MNNQTETIRKFVGYVNNEAHLGGFWLPNIQRPFVWSESQIERLYDSILREYPIGTLLIWKTNGEIKHRKFIDNWKDSIRLIDFYVPTDKKPKMLVLDGQQRMQSLFIGLKGSYNGKELYFNILSGEKRSPEDIRFDFRFMEASSATFPWVKFKSIVLTDQRPKEIKKGIESTAGRALTEAEDDRMDENITQVRDVFCTQENILYQEVDSIDRSDSYSEDDIVEIFIRANSGGTFLNKSDLMFSLLISSWDEAEERVTDLLDVLNKTGYEFNRDFILKTCLVLLGKGARYNVDKFRDKNTRDEILTKWEDISNAVKLVKDYIYGSTFLKTDKTVPSYLSLIPLIYYAYHYPKDWQKHLPDYQTYLIRTALSSAYGGQPDNLIDKLIKNINEQQDFKISEILGVIREDGRSLEISKEALLSIGYWRKEIHLLFNIWYGFNYQPTLADNKPQIDHIFPQSALKAIKVVNPETGKMNVMKYKWWDRDQLPNLMLLTQAENGAGGKTDILPEVWFEGKSEAYLDLHLIPKDTNLWKVENYEAFIEARKELILKKFEYLLYK
jgi:uncharacterized protein with ParB-like and HNH nuclease domain